jgi:hypothetical protein
MGMSALEDGRGNGKCAVVSNVCRNAQTSAVDKAGWLYMISFVNVEVTRIRHGLQLGIRNAHSQRNCYI